MNDALEPVWAQPNAQALDADDDAPLVDAFGFPVQPAPPQRNKIERLPSSSSRPDFGQTARPQSVPLHQDQVAIPFYSQQQQQVSKNVSAGRYSYDMHHVQPQPVAEAIGSIEQLHLDQENYPIAPTRDRSLTVPDAPAVPKRKEPLGSSTSTPLGGLAMPTSTASLLSYEATLELYRQNAKKSNDPQIQLDFAKYLIQISEAIEVQPGDKQARKTKEGLQNEGIKWIKRLATSGLGLGKPAFPEAQFFLAECYGNGALGLSIDHDRAFSLYVQASKQNHAAATYRAAVCYEIGAGPRKDYARAVQFYRKAAALGDVGAMYKLAVILLNGAMNTPKNEREGVTWLKRAAAGADEQHPEALHELAVVYEKGDIPSVIVDESYARELYVKAAQLGYAPSQFKLGYCYEYGSLTCDIDPRRSIAWYTRAAEQGHPEAELALSGWYLTGCDGILEQNDTEAYLWARKAAEKGFGKAEYAVGYYSEGKFQEDDFIF